MTTLADFLNARWDELAADIADVHARGCSAIPAPYFELGSCDCGVPARVLGDIAGKRLLVETYQQFDDAGEDESWWYADQTYDVLRAFARVYQDHPDFDPGWAV